MCTNCACVCVSVSQLQRCVHIKTWLLFNMLTLTMNPDNCKASSSSFSFSRFSLCLLIILILSIPSFFLGYRCCSVKNNNTVICLITLKKHLLLSWSPVQEQLWDQGTSNVVVRPWVIISDHAETQYSPQLHLIIVFVVLRGLKWPPLVSVSRKY